MRIRKVGVDPAAWWIVPVGPSPHPWSFTSSRRVRRRRPFWIRRELFTSTSCHIIVIQCKGYDLWGVVYVSKRTQLSRFSFQCRDLAQSSCLWIWSSRASWNWMHPSCVRGFLRFVPLNQFSKNQMPRKKTKYVTCLYIYIYICWYNIYIYLYIYINI